MDRWVMKGRGWVNYNTCDGGWRHNRRRPPPLGARYVHSWEKYFCASIGSVPWRKILEAKKLIYLYEDVASWNDSGGEEAFLNAKNLFLANINGLPCDIKLPDPDIYIDKVDWDAEAGIEDHDLFLELDWARIHTTVEDTILQEPDNPAVLCNYGWDDIVEEEQPQGCWKQTNNAYITLELVPQGWGAS